MGVTIQIRDVDQGVRDRLKVRAAQEGVSLNSFLRRLLAREAAKPSQAEVFARVNKRAKG